MNNQRLAAKRLPLLPGRVSGPRNGTGQGTVAQQAGDVFWKCSVQCFTPVYTRIDQRFGLTERVNDAAVKEQHAALISEAKKILQEHRNEIFERVLPMFIVNVRKNEEEPTEADVHVHDYFVLNVFTTMVDMLVAQLPTFVLPDDVQTVTRVVRNIADVQKQRLEALLLNFTFEFRPVVTTKRKG